MNARPIGHRRSNRAVTAAAILVAAFAASSPAQEQGRQILINPDFKLPVAPSGDPPGWFKAMIPAQTDGLRTSTIPHLVLEQKGVSINLFNNWAQRVDNPPAGGAFRFETEINVSDAPQGALVGVFFFSGEKMIGVASPPNMNEPPPGNSLWKKCSVDGTFPTDCKTAIVRLGLNAGGGRLMIRSARLFLLDRTKEGGPSPVTPGNPPARDWTAGLELLTNGGFEGEAVNETPNGWFRAMMPNLAIDHKAGTENIEGHGNVVYITQSGTKASLLNNWAQRLEVIPVGARLKLSAQVKAENVPENTGVVMIQCWKLSASPDGELLAVATSQTSNPIGGTTDWKSVEMEITVPEKTEAIIVRCGIMQSGKIWFDNVSLKIISAPPEKRASSAEPTRAGFLADEAGLARLEKINSLSAKLLELAREQLGGEVDLRKEVYALGDGKFEVVLAFSFR